MPSGRSRSRPRCLDTTERVSRPLATVVCPVRTLLAVLVLSLSLGCAHPHPLEAHDGSMVRAPRTINGAMRALDRLLDPELIEALRSGEVEAIELHHGLGAALRSHWGLWAGSALAVSLRVRGVSHPDDMSAVILDAYVRRLRGQPRALQREIAELERYYEQQDAFYEAEAKSGPERAARVEAARMGWTLAPHDPDALPRLPSPRAYSFGEQPYAMRLEPHAGGVVVFHARARGESAPPGATWYADLYFLADAEAELEPVERPDCEQIHDMVALGDASRWLCRNGEQWWLIHEHDDHTTRERIELEADALRLATRGIEVLLVDERSVYAREGQGWEAIYTREEPWMPLAGQTPHLVGTRLAYDSDWSGWNVIDLASPALIPDGHDYAQQCEWLLRPYYGRWANHCYEITPRADGRLWITGGFRHQATLMLLDGDGSSSLAVFAGSLDRPAVYDEGLLVQTELDADGLGRQIPATAVAERDGVLYLAGELGISSVRDGRVEPLLRFAPDDDQYWSGTRSPGPNKLVVFGGEEPSFAFSSSVLVLVYPSGEGWSMRRGPPVGLGRGREN